MHVHSFNTVKTQELVRFNRAMVYDGMLGTSYGAVHRRWLKGSTFDKSIHDSMNHSRILQTKRVVKLNDNDEAILRG